MDVDRVFGGLQYGIGLQRRHDLDYRRAQWNSGQCRDKHVRLNGYRFHRCDGYRLFRYHDPGSDYSHYSYIYSGVDHFEHASERYCVEFLQHLSGCYRRNGSLHLVP